MKNLTFTEYNINAISLNWLINNIVESTVTRYFISMNLNTETVSRDTKRLIFHFVAKTVLDTLSEHSNERNILIFDENVHLTLFSSHHTAFFQQSCAQIIKRFGLCTFFTDKKLVDLTLDDIYKIKQLSDNCAIRSKNLSRLKKFLEKNNYTALSKQLKTSKSAQFALTI